MLSLGHLRSVYVVESSSSYELLVYYVRFHRYRLCTVHCEPGPLSQVLVHCLTRQRTPFLARTGLTIGTNVHWVAGISYQVFQKSLPYYLFWLVAVLELENFRCTACHARHIIVRVKFRSMFDLSPDPYSVLCHGGCLFHLYPVSYIVHQSQCHISPSLLIDWCVSLDCVFW